MRIVSDGEQKRGKILETACAVFVEKGYHKATFVEMGKRGKFNPALINFHFRSKDNLYCAIWHRLKEQVEANWPIDGNLDADAAPTERLRAHVQASLGQHSDKRTASFIRIRLQESVSPTGLLDAELEKRSETHRTHMRSLIGELLGEAATDSDIDLCEMSIISQFSITRPPKPDGSAPPKKRRKSAEFPKAEIDRLTDHITAFSLGGIKGIRQIIAQRKEQS